MINELKQRRMVITEHIEGHYPQDKVDILMKDLDELEMQHFDLEKSLGQALLEYDQYDGHLDSLQQWIDSKEKELALLQSTVDPQAKLAGLMVRTGQYLPKYKHKDVRFRLWMKKLAKTRI